MIKNYPTFKILAPLFFFLFSFSAFSQEIDVYDNSNVYPVYDNSLNSPQILNTTDFGMASSVEFLVINTRGGSGNIPDLTISGISISNTTDFVLTPNYNFPIDIKKGNSQWAIGLPFTISLKSTSCGTFTSTVTIASNATNDGTDNVLTFTISATNALINNNIITATQTICTSTTPAALIGSTPTGGNGTYTYLWESSTTSALTGYATASGINNTKNYTPGALTQTTWYRRTVISGCSNISSAIQITVSPTSVGGTVSGGTTICSGSTSGLLTLSSHTGNVIRWESSTNNFTTITTIANTALTYTSGALTQTTQFRAVVQSGNCSAANSTSATVTVNPTSVGGTATATASSTCSGGSTIITLTGYIGSIQWQSNASGSFVNILSATSATYTTPVLTSTTSYRAIVTSGVCNYSTSSVAIVTVNTLPTAPITTNAFICTGSSATLAASGAITDQTYNWYTLESGGSSVNTTNSYNTPALTATTDYWVAVVNSNGCESVRTKATAFVNVKNIWNGSVDRDWNKAGNWCIGVPTEGVLNTLDVLIPSGLLANKYPILSSGTSGYVENIVFETGTTLNVIDNSLRVTLNLTLNGNSLIDFEGESQLLQDDLSGFIGTGTIEIDQQGTGNSFNYNYWSSPVNSNLAAKTYSIGAVLKDGTDATYKPIDFGAAHTWADGAATPAFIKLSTYWMYKLENSKGYAAWSRVGNTGEMSVGQGYTMKGSNTTLAEQNYTFVGKPNNGTIELDVNEGNEYLVGNPYPSAIDAEQFLIDNGPTGTDIIGVGSALHFWEHSGGGTHNLAGYQGGYATYNLSGGSSAATGGQVAGVGTFVNAKKIPRRYIPVGQAFFVVGNHAGKIRFKNSQRIFVKESQVYKDIDNNDVPFSVFMKSSNTKSKTDNTDLSDLRPKFRIGYDAPKISHRQLLLTVDERATKAVDWGFDAEIFEIFVDDFYWMLDGKKYIIQGTNNVGLNSEVPLGIQLSKTGMVTVKIDALENVDDDTTIYLKDKVTGESFNMREKPVELNLTAGKYADRFVLIFKTQKLMAEDVKAEILIPATAQPIIEGIHVFMNNASGELQIKNNSTEEIVSVALVNTLGQTIKTWNSNFNIRTISLPISTATGVYLVQISTITGKTVKKISVE